MFDCYWARLGLKTRVPEATEGVEKRSRSKLCMLAGAESNRIGMERAYRSLEIRARHDMKYRYRQQARRGCVPGGSPGRDYSPVEIVPARLLHC